MKSINSVLYDANFKNVLPENIDINKDIFVNPDDASMFTDKKYHDKICYNHLINFPMCIRSGIYNNQYSEFSFTKNGVLWRLVTNGSFDNLNELPWGIYCFDQNNSYFIDDDEKIEYFLYKIYEMPDCSKEEKDIFYHYLKKHNKITRDYYNKLLSKEEATEKLKQSFAEEEENNKTLKK